MPHPNEAARLLGTPLSSESYARSDAPGLESGYPARARPVDVNVMKRNMSIAKGFMDISLLTANASQLKHIIQSGNTESYTYNIILTGLILSVVLQIITGVLLIAKERFDLNIEDDHASADFYNNLTVALVFVTLLLNVFVSSFGPSPMKYDPKQQIGYTPPVYKDLKGRALGPIDTTTLSSMNPYAEIMTTAAAFTG